MLKQLPVLLTAGLLTASAPTVAPAEDPTPIAEVPCPGCTAKEQRTIAFLNANGITDANAQAVFLGTIKQESRWNESVCEGGATTPYERCTRGGWGLIQWTYASRYAGLKRYAKSIGTTPECFDTQLAYILTEPEWKKVEHVFKTEGLPLWQYEQAEYQWIGWGIKGKRAQYTREYIQQIT